MCTSRRKKDAAFKINRPLNRNHLYHENKSIRFCHTWTRRLGSKKNLGRVQSNKTKEMKEIDQNALSHRDKRTPRRNRKERNEMQNSLRTLKSRFKQFNLCAHRIVIFQDIRRYAFSPITHILHARF